MPDIPVSGGAPAAAQPAAPAAEPVAQPNGGQPAAPAQPAAGAQPGQPAAQPAAQPNAGAQPAAGEQPAQPAADDITALLGEDLQPVAAEPQPLDKYKDDPAVQELIKTSEQAAPFQKVISEQRYQITNAQELDLQLRDSAALYDIMQGKAPARSILETMLNNAGWSEQQKQAVLSDLAAFIGEKTGKPVVANAAGAQPGQPAQPAVDDPAMAEIKKLQERIAAQDKAAADAKAAQETAAYNKRVEAAQGTVKTKVGDLLKGTFAEGQGDHFFSLVGQQLAGKEQQVIAEIEAGNFSSIEKAVVAARKAEAARFKAYNDNLLKLKQAKAAAIPNQPAAAAQPVVAQPGQPAGEKPVEKMTDEERRQWMTAQLGKV